MQHGQREKQDGTTRNHAQPGSQPIEPVHEVDGVDEQDRKERSQECSLDLVEDDRGSITKGQEEKSPRQTETAHDGRRHQLPDQLDQSTQFQQVIHHADEYDGRG